MAEKTTSSPRRSKTEAEASGAPTNSNAERLLEQLRNALLKLEHSAVRMDTLHWQWNNYLILLSLFVLGISLYQLYISGSQCYSDVQFWNGNPTSPLVVRPTTAVGMILRYSMLYIISILMIVLLALFLQKKLVLHNSNAGEMLPLFRHAYFRFAQSCLGPILFLYYNKCMSGKDTKGSSSYDILPCIPKSWLALIEKDGNAHPAFVTMSSPQQFPVVVIFFIIASLSIYFMQQQRKQMTHNKNAILTLQTELQQRHLPKENATLSQGPDSSKSKTA
jgi:hypothetical protein